MIKFDQFIQVIHDAALSANKTLANENQNLIDQYFERSKDIDPSDKSLEILKPKTVIIQYPTLTQEGVVMKNVNVPLIALIPISMAEISEIKIKTNIEILADDEKNLSISFPTKEEMAKALSNNNESHYSSMEITVKPHESPGLSTMIKGYEKALRAQIPH